MKKVKIYVMATPISEWQYIGTVEGFKAANKVYINATVKGYYCKLVEEK